MILRIVVARELSTALPCVLYKGSHPHCCSCDKTPPRDVFDGFMLEDCPCSWSLSTRLFLAPTAGDPYRQHTYLYSNTPRSCSLVYPR